MATPKSFAGELLPALAPAAIFALIAYVAVGPTAPRIDNAVRDAVHTVASAPLTEFAKFVTAFGSGWFLYPVSGVICILLWREKKQNDAILLALAVAGAMLTEDLLKAVFHRARPEPFFSYAKPDSYSFPSGHALVSYCFYLSLAEVLIQQHWPNWKKVAVRGVALLLILVISFTRVYLGVHYPTDVAAGLAAAMTWLIVVRAAHRRAWGRGARQRSNARPRSF